MQNVTKTKIGTAVTHKKTGKTMYLYDYRRSDDIDVLFDDGTIAKNKRCNHFINGKIQYPENGEKINMEAAMKSMKQKAKNTKNKNKKEATKHLNEEGISSHGQKMKIIRYKNSRDIDIQFENGGIAYHKTYGYFKRGNIANPKLHLGEKKIAKNGMLMEITEYYDSQHITITFEDGTIVTNKSYQAFKRGTIENPNLNIDAKLYINKKRRINQTSTTKDGTPITCIEYYSTENITVQFPDGSIREHITWRDFKLGKVAKTKDKNHTNETNINNNGLKMTITKYEPGKKPIVQFEDGYTTQASSYYNFRRGSVTHNTLKAYNSLTGHVKGTLYNTTILGVAHNYRNTAHYFCECQICKTREIWNFEQIKNHECNKTAATESESTGTYNA